MVIQLHTVTLLYQILYFWIPNDSNILSRRKYLQASEVISLAKMVF